MLAISCFSGSLSLCGRDITGKKAGLNRVEEGILEAQLKLSREIPATSFFPGWQCGHRKKVGRIETFLEHHRS